MADDIVLDAAAFILLFCLKVCIAASVDVSTFRARLHRKAGIAIGVICQFLILPLAGFCIVKLMDFHFVYGVSLMVIMSSPGGSYSNWWCAIFNADLAMSVAMTGVSTVIGVIMLPLNLYVYCLLLYGKDMFNSKQLSSIALSLSIIIVALCVGLFTSWKLNSESWRRAFNVMGNCVGVALLLVSLVVNERQSSTKVWETPVRVHVATATPLTLTIFLTVLVSSIPAFKLRKPERIAVVIEACYQNPSLATTILLGIFNGMDAGDAVAVPLVYGGYEALLLGLFCLVAYYLNWTLVDANEVSLIAAIKGNWQHLSIVEDGHVLQPVSSLNQSSVGEPFSIKDSESDVIFHSFPSSMERPSSLRRNSAASGGAQVQAEEHSRTHPESTA